MALPEISHKTNRVLQVILTTLFLISFRIWHLGVVQREEKLLEAQKPQTKTHLIRANRGTICDRFMIPLAVNRICYNAAIYYSHLSEIPVIAWKSDPEGNRMKTFPRKEYIQKLSVFLSKELGLDPARIEDEIHSKASLFPHVPYTIKADLTEEEHYRLNQAERLWPGLQAEIAAERFYPQGKTAANIIGSMGSISSREYSALVEEISLLQKTVSDYESGNWETFPPGYQTIDEIYRRLHELKEKAYTLNDRVGKTGIEAKLEQELRGYFGKKRVEIDLKGRYVRNLPGARPAVPGRQIVLSISSELQQFAESLLTQDEKGRDNRSIGLDPITKIRKPLKQPWIKGGAIVAFEPTTGEVLALASHPRFNPNDFIPSGPDKTSRAKQIHRWLEDESYLAALWDGREVLTRERFNRVFQEEIIPLTWDLYLDLILPLDGPLRPFFQKYDDLRSAIQLQEDVEALLYYTKTENAQVLFDSLFPTPKPLILESIRMQGPDALSALKRLDSALHSIPAPADKLFVIDLFRLAVYNAAFTDELIQAVGNIKIASYRSFNQIFQQTEAFVKTQTQQEFRIKNFKQWRDSNQKTFLAEKRAREKELKTYARPYLDYLDEKEKQLFTEYWEEHRLAILADFFKKNAHSDESVRTEWKESLQKFQELFHSLSSERQIEWLRTFRSYATFDRPLLGTYRRIPKPSLEKHLAAAFYPTGGFGFSRSLAFQSSAPPGSVFKLIPAYAALQQNIPPFTMIDQQGSDPKSPSSKAEFVGFSSSGTPYPRHYKGGRLPRSSNPHIGKIDLISAIEQSSNPYFSLLAGDFLSSPDDLLHTAKLFGFGEKTGIELPSETTGNLPNDLKTNRTGLYSTAIGQHTVLATPLQTAAFIASLANGGKLLQPKIVREIIGPVPDRSSLEPFHADHYLAQEELQAIGIPFPLFTAAQPRSSKQERTVRSTQMKRQIPLPHSIRNQLFEGLDRVVWGTKGSARATIIRKLLTNPLWMRDYLSFEHAMIGKTSTAEFLYNPNLNPSSEPHLYKNIGFAAISFLPDKIRWAHPELVVIVYLRFGDSGKEAAPLALQMIQKWREIKARHERHKID